MKFDVSDLDLRALKRFVKLDAGHNNVTLYAGDKELHLGKYKDWSDGEIEALVKWMAGEILELRREIYKLSTTNYR